MRRVISRRTKAALAAAKARGVKLGLSARRIQHQQAKSLCDESFTSVKQLRGHIDNFIDDYNAKARPFVWTKSEVHQKRLKARFADQ